MDICSRASSCWRFGAEPPDGAPSVPSSRRPPSDNRHNHRLDLVPPAINDWMTQFARYTRGKNGALPSAPIYGRTFSRIYQGSSSFLRSYPVLCAFLIKT
jgi:hypothetical protein